MINSNQTEDVVLQTFKCYLKKVGHSTLSRDEQMQPEFVDFQNFALGLVLLEGRLFFRPGRSKKPTRWDFARTVIRGWFE